MLRRYVLSRVLAGIFGLIVFLTATFFMAKLLVPGDITSNFAVGFGGNLKLAIGFRRAVAKPWSWLPTEPVARPVLLERLAVEVMT